MTHRLLAALLCALPLITLADDTPWHGKRAAVALTYDDSLNVHLDTVLPALDAYGLKGTFYLTVGAAPFAERLDEWRAAAREGHELGNHTLYHPCSGQGPGREWVNPARDLSQWSLERMVANIRVANTTLKALDGKTERTFAYPCGDTEAGGASYVEAIRSDFVGARGVSDGLEQPGEVALFAIDSHMVNGESAEALKARVDRAIDQGALLVFLFHGVGGEHNLNVSAANHQALVDYLHQREDDVWVAPMVDIARYLRERRDAQ